MEKSLLNGLIRSWLVLITVHVWHQILLGNCAEEKTVPFVDYKMLVCMSDVVFHSEPPLFKPQRA